MAKYIHFIVNMSIQLILLLLAYYNALYFYRTYFDAALNNVPIYVSFLGLFVAVYFILMWKDLYAHEMHSYLKVTIQIIGKNLFISLMTLLGVIIITSFILEELALSSIKAIIFFSFGAFALFGMHLLYYLWLKSLSIHGYFHKKVLLVGHASHRFHVEKFFQDMGETKEFCGTLTVQQDTIPKINDTEDESEQKMTWIWDNSPISHLAPESTQNQAQPNNNIKFYRNLMDVIYQHHIGEMVIFLGPNLSQKIIQHITNICDRYAIGYYLVPDISSLPKNKYWDSIFAYVPIIAHKTTNRDNLFNISIKRLFDIFFSIIILLLFLPFGLIISCLIFMCDFGPIFYVSKRIGKDQKSIPFFKFRTMQPNAEQMKAKLLKLNERKGDGPLFKMKKDPRITPIGHFLRRTSLDEFPQFLNVLLGHLSIVGPRPHLPQEVQHYEGKDFMRLECMPGITCLPQLRDRNSMGFHEWVNLDLYYRKNWTLRMDFIIFWQTGLLFLKSFFYKENN